MKMLKRYIYIYIYNSISIVENLLITFCYIIGAFA